MVMASDGQGRTGIRCQISLTIVYRSMPLILKLCRLFLGYSLILCILGRAILSVIQLRLTFLEQPHEGANNCRSSFLPKSGIGDNIRNVTTTDSTIQIEYHHLFRHLIRPLFVAISP
jgi:hypothetical protein